jgi:16S rRNA (cytosine967-C5)-methyltransferase
VTSTRRLALDVLVAIEGGRRTAAALAQSGGRDGLDERDRAFVTELVNGSTRMRRACDHVAQPFIRRKLDPEVRSAIRMGVYQLVMMGTPAHAAVNDTVAATPKRARGLVNAVLRRVSEVHEPRWPRPAIEHSYPDWLWSRAEAQWGSDGAAALIAMNTPERPNARADGYVQGRASQWVSDVVDATSPQGGVLLDLCAAPGGKTTGVGSHWTTVGAVELDVDRCGVLQRTLQQYRPAATALRADATVLPFRSGSVDAVLLDAPCTGLGALGRRSDARWAIEPDAVDRLAGLQRRLIDAAFEVVRPGGVLVYSVCTFTHQETTGVIDGFVARHPTAELLPIEGDQWRRHGQGAIVLPQDHGTDAMAVFAIAKPH